MLIKGGDRALCSCLLLRFLLFPLGEKVEEGSSLLLGFRRLFLFSSSSLPLELLALHASFFDDCQRAEHRPALSVVLSMLPSVLSHSLRCMYTAPQSPLAQGTLSRWLCSAPVCSYVDILCLLVGRGWEISTRSLRTVMGSYVHDRYRYARILMGSCRRSVTRCRHGWLCVASAYLLPVGVVCLLSARSFFERVGIHLFWRFGSRCGSDAFAFAVQVYFVSNRLLRRDVCRGLCHSQGEASP